MTDTEATKREALSKLLQVAAIRAEELDDAGLGDEAAELREAAALAATAVEPRSSGEREAETLVVLIAAYEMDEPHWDDGSEPEVRWDADTLRGWLAEPHFGDCIGEPNSCQRCLAEHWWHKARWIASRLRQREPDAPTLEERGAHRAYIRWRIVSRPFEPSEPEVFAAGYRAALSRETP